MRTFVVYIALLTLALYTSCTSNPAGVNRLSDAVLEETEACLIPLDSMTTQSPVYIQVVDDSTMIFFNRPSYDMCIVNLKTKTTDKIKVYREGPNEVPSVDAFCYISPDSIWLYESWGKKMTLIDSAGVIQEKLQLPETNKDGSRPEYSVLPFATTTTPYIVRGKKHILQGMSGNVVGGQIPGVTVVYDAERESVVTANPYPGVYGEVSEINGKWSPFGYRQTTFSLSPDGGIVTSFPASDSLYVYYPDMRKRIAFYAGYSEPTNIKSGQIKNDEDEAIHFITHYNYGAVIYDSNEGVYYRMIRLPKKDFDHEKLNEEVAKKMCAVIILDQDFNIIGETVLPEDQYYPMHSFVNSDGLHILTLSDDDDFMKFRVFKLKR